MIASKRPGGGSPKNWGIPLACARLPGTVVTPVQRKNLMRGTHDGNMSIGPDQFGVAVNLMGWVTSGDLPDDQPFVEIRASRYCTEDQNNCHRGGYSSIAAGR